MRLLNRNKQPIFISSETFQGSGEYKDPVEYRGIISSVNSFVREATGIIVDEFDEMVTFEVKDIVGKRIVKTSHFWLRKEPDEVQLGSDYTHDVKGITVSPNNQFVMIVLSGTDGYNPIM
jgi:hypothetical protein